MWLRLLHDLVNNELGVPSDHEPSGTYFGRNLDSVDERLVLGDVIGGVEVKADHVAELVSLGQCEDDTRVASGFEVGSIEVHGLVL